MSRPLFDPYMGEVAGRIERAAIERYSSRLRQFGVDPRTLGWDTWTDQCVRFEAVTDLVDLNNKDLVDIGCGFADF